MIHFITLLCILFHQKHIHPKPDNSIIALPSYINSFRNFLKNPYEHPFMCLLPICMYSLEKCLLGSLAHFLIGSFSFLVLSCISCLYILEINYLPVALFDIIFYHPEGCLFTCLQFPLLCKSSHSLERLPSQSLQTINAEEGVEKREPSYTVGGNANQYSRYGEQCGDSLINWNQNCRRMQQSHCWAHTLRKPKLKETHVSQCSLQHCLQQLGHGSNLDVHRQTNG